DRLSANFNRKVSVSGRSFAYETLIQEADRKLARHLTAPTGRFDLSCSFEVGESGHVTPELKDRVLSLTLAERKAAGISKTTWHYIRKRAENGRPLRLYEKVTRRIPT
ncbi:CRISPR-associated protein Cas1, partial [mine drainage metagenome]